MTAQECYVVQIKNRPNGLWRSVGTYRRYELALDVAVRIKRRMPHVRVRIRATYTLRRWHQAKHLLCITSVQASLNWIEAEIELNWFEMTEVELNRIEMKFHESSWSSPPGPLESLRCQRNFNDFLFFTEAQLNLIFWEFAWGPSPPGPLESLLVQRKFSDFPSLTEAQLKLIFCEFAWWLGPQDL